MSLTDSCAVYANEQHRCGFRLRPVSCYISCMCLLNLFFLQDQGGEVCICLCPPDLRLGAGGSSEPPEPPEPPQPTGLPQNLFCDEILLLFDWNVGYVHTVMVALSFLFFQKMSPPEHKAFLTLFQAVCRKWPGNFYNFRLYMTVTLWILHHLRLVHMKVSGVSCPLNQLLCCDTESSLKKTTVKIPTLFSEMCSAMEWV